MTRFDKFTAILANNLKGFGVKFKDESTLMKIIGFFLFFNKVFMTGFVTTIGKTVYWPSRARLEKTSDQSSITVLAHEYQHSRDANRLSFILFGASYLFPQVLALPGIVLALSAPVWVPLMATGVISWSWWLLPLLLTLAFLAPIPAPWRRHYELRGYIMTLFVLNEFFKEKGLVEGDRALRLRAQVAAQDKQFTGGNYYFMWPFGVQDNFNDAIDDIISEKILEKDHIYQEIAVAIRDSK